MPSPLAKNHIDGKKHRRSKKDSPFQIKEIFMCHRCVKNTKKLNLLPQFTTKCILVLCVFVG